MPPVSSKIATKPSLGFAGYLDLARRSIPSEPFYKIGPLLLLLVILIGTLLVPMLASCAPNWDAQFRTFGLEKRIEVIG